MKFKFLWGMFEFESGRSFSIKNVLDPLTKLGIYLVGPVSLVAISSGVYMESLVPILCGLLLIFIFVVFIMVQFNFFRKTNPEFLQSETFLIEKMREVTKRRAKHEIDVTPENEEVGASTTASLDGKTPMLLADDDMGDDKE